MYLCCLHSCYVVECEHPRLRLTVHSDGHVGAGFKTRPLLDLQAQVGVGGTYTDEYLDALTTSVHEVCVCVWGEGGGHVMCV